jgi:uncharacterized protein (DUF1778 family)
VNTKTSQLQIRVTPEQKATLKRLAAEAGTSVSSYVLSAVLPPTQAEFQEQLSRVHAAPVRSGALAAFLSFLGGLSDDEFPGAVAEANLDTIPLLKQNLIAAGVEQEASRRGLRPPVWTNAVAMPERPYFAWDLWSLRPHLMHRTPLAFKRRTLFLTAPGGEA